MAILINLDVILAKRKMRLKELSEATGISMTNLSILKTGKARAIRFSTLNIICSVLKCQPGDILEYVPDDPHAPEGTSGQPLNTDPDLTPPHTSDLSRAAFDTLPSSERNEI